MFKKGIPLLVLFLLVSWVAHQARAQFTTATLGINGLTCSQCSRSVEVALRKLPFVQSVNMNLQQTQCTIMFKQKQAVHIADLAKAVKSAGFSVRFLQARLLTNAINIQSNYCFAFQNDLYRVAKPMNESSSELHLVFIGKDYMPAKEWKKYTTLPSPCAPEARYMVDILD
jgi:copper chaperone CopZ